MNTIHIENNPVIELITITGNDSLEEIRRLFLDYAKSLSINLCFQNFSEELVSLPGKYGPPEGALLLALVDGKSAGCVALHKLSSGVCEMKRLYVRNEYRGLGLGKRLIKEVISEAATRNYQYIRLDTLSTMTEALNLYQAFGFYDIEPYVYNPIKGARYLELKIDHTT